LRVRGRFLLVGVLGGLVLTGLPAGPASAQGAITCAVASPGSPVVTSMDTAVAGVVTCTNSEGHPVTLSLAPYVLDAAGPSAGRVDFDASGAFTYTPGFYPLDPATGKRDRLPEYSGPDSFLVNATSPDGATAQLEVPIEVQAPAKACPASFTAATRTMFNDPAGDDTAQYRMLRHLIDLIDCTPALNPDGSQASIKFSFYSLTYAPIMAALTAAALRGVSVQALTNSHSDKYPAWRQINRALGSDTTTANFATTCWQGCLTPRTPPTAGGPTAWYSADATTLTSNTVVFTDRSIAGAAPIVRWQYDFGDGTTAEGPGPHTKTYAAAGTYETSLTVTDANSVTHKLTGSKTLPDNMEPMYPSLHSKIYLFSTVGSGATTRQWVSAYSSGNPTYQQSRKGFNNLNLAVGDQTLYNVFAQYFGDMVAASRGQLLGTNYFRSFETPGNAATGARPTTVHFGPQTSGDINRDILRSIKCKYRSGGKLGRTDIKISMFVLTRRGVAGELWKLAMQKGCNVHIVYTQMSQRVRGADGKWLTNEDGEETSYGSADCLSTPPSRVVVTKAAKGRPARRRTVPNTLNGPDGYCSGGSLRGSVPITSSGKWLDRRSPYGGGRLVIQMACPVQPKYDPVKKQWAVLCIRNDIFTHHKLMLVNGHVRGAVQKYVMSGSANWSTPGLRQSDEVITEIRRASDVYKQYLSNFNHMRSVVAQNSVRAGKKGRKKSSFQLRVLSDQVVDVRGATMSQLRSLTSE
jgi:hypothetical protein